MKTSTSNEMAVCYYRISKNTGDNERQINDVNAYCKANDIKILKEFQEKISGSKKKRPATIELFKFLETTKVNFVIISELSRLGRTNEVLSMVDTLDQMNICLISLKENLKTLDPNPSEQSKSRLILNIWTGLNNYELATISYRIKSGRDYAVINKGSWGGSNHWNYGYKTIASKLVINEQEAEVIKLIYSKLIEGWGCVKIGNYLNSQGILTRGQINGNPSKKWMRSTVYQILINKIYIGLRKWQKEEFNVPELRILSDYTFNEVQKKLTDRKTSSPEFSKLQKYNYLFDKGLIRCGKCGKTYIGIHRYNVYKCASGKVSKGCGNPSVKIDFIEEVIQAELSGNWINLVLMGVKGTDTTSLKISLDLQKQEILKLEKRIERIKELYIDGNYSKIEFEIKTNSTFELLNKSKVLAEALEEQIQNAAISSVLEMISGDLTEEKIKDLRFPKEVLRNIITGIVINEKNINVSLLKGFEFSIPI